MAKLPGQPKPFASSPIFLLVLSGFAVLLGLIWLDEAVDLPHVLLGAPPVPMSWQAALLRSVWITSLALLMCVLLVRLVRRRREDRRELMRLAGRQRTAEEALHLSEAHLRKAQEVASIGSWDLDLTTGSLYWSDEVYRIFGVPRGTPLDYATFLETILPEDREFVDESWHAALRGAPYDLEHRIRVDGEVGWVREKAEVEFDESGRAVRGIGIVQDITARKAAEEEADRLEAELAHVTRIATLGEFSAALAHELNQPLAAMLSNAQAALRFFAAGDPDLAEIREILEDIVKDDQRARDVILKLRELTRKPADHQERSSVDLDHVTEGVLRIARGDLALRGVTAKMAMPEDLAPVSANEIQLQQALLNLILNALEAMEGSPVRTLTLQARNADEETVEIAVSDTGSGLDPERREHLFDPFFTTKEHGMGMGLAISRAIVDAHQGQLRAEAAPEGGARFVISLPALRGDS